MNTNPYIRWKKFNRLQINVGTAQICLGLVFGFLFWRRNDFGDGFNMSLNLCVGGWSLQKGFSHLRDRLKAEWEFKEVRAMRVHMVKLKKESGSSKPIPPFPKLPRRPK